MRLYQQLILFMLAATVLPLAIVGFWLLRSAEAELSRQISSEQRALAVLAADGVSSQVMGAVNAIARAADAIDWEHATPDEVKGGLSLLYKQDPSVSAVAMVQADGTIRGDPVYVTAGGGGHPAFKPDGLGALVRAIPLGPLQQGGKGQAAISRAYLDSAGDMAAMALAVKLASERQAPFALAELGLANLAQGLAERTSPQSGRIDIVDSGGRVVASSEPVRILRNLETPLWTAAQGHLESTAAESFVANVRGRMLVSTSQVPDVPGLYAIVSVDEDVALAPVRAMRKTVLFSIGGALAILLALGGLFTRRLSSRIASVMEGVESFTKGDLTKRIPVSGADEMADLAETFNAMGAELEVSRAKLLSWNDELKQKVDEATADLRSAQAQLVEAQKLAAVGQLGAGVAHEINNPLAGILGNTQLLMLDRGESDTDFQTLRKIEQAAKRCKEITQNLLRFSQQREKAEFRPVDLNAVVRDALSLTTNQSKGEGVSISAKLKPGPLNVRGDPGHLSQVLLALLSNARVAMIKSAEKVLTVTTREIGEEAVVEVADTGKGILPEHLPRIFEPFFTTKDVWTNVGLGLSVAYRVMSEHKGKIEVQTAVGKGSTFTVRMPKLAEKRA